MPGGFSNKSQNGASRITEPFQTSCCFLIGEAWHNANYCIPWITINGQTLTMRWPKNRGIPRSRYATTTSSGKQNATGMAQTDLHSTAVDHVTRLTAIHVG